MIILATPIASVVSPIRSKRMHAANISRLYFPLLSSPTLSLLQAATLLSPLSLSLTSTELQMTLECTRRLCTCILYTPNTLASAHSRVRATDRRVRILISIASGFSARFVRSPQLTYTQLQTVCTCIYI